MVPELSNSCLLLVRAPVCALYPTPYLIFISSGMGPASYSEGNPRGLSVKEIWVLSMLQEWYLGELFNGGPFTQEQLAN